MWMISSLDLSMFPGAAGYMSDGNAVVGVQRSGVGASVRLMITGVGMFDFTDCGPQPGGPQQYQLAIGGASFPYVGATALTVTALADGQCLITVEALSLAVAGMPFPLIEEADRALLFEMVELGMIPYPDVPKDGRPYTALLPQSQAYFPWSEDAALLGLTIYDWTTADFFRMDIFNYFRYTMLPGSPLDGPNITTAIWTTNWPPYVAADPTFMGSMLMTAATNEMEVAQQYSEVSSELVVMLDCLKRVTVAALQAMPRTGVAAIPCLYSGQVDVSNLGLDAFATYFMEYPGNAGPVATPMGEPLATALAGFLGQGNSVTLKSFMSTTDSQADAAHYSTGIVLQISPNAAHAIWGQCTYITPLSDEATKTEYLFSPGTQFLMGDAVQTTIGGKSVMLIQMTALD